MSYSSTPTKTRNENLVKLLPPQGMSRAKDILQFLPFGRTTLHEWSQDDRFPASIKLSPTMVAWRNSDVLEWIENHSNPADNTQENTND
ncbi:helix-turn-helix transcriptional regulator [Psychrobacter sp. AOP29-E1-7]|uniref:helix-turn-helix transcriptional regulator n=1 Tax=Psychrobacter sp. AOP29-E1-7 TaxID=3457702 RepID=UPI00403530A6